MRFTSCGKSGGKYITQIRHGLRIDPRIRQLFDVQIMIDRIVMLDWQILIVAPTIGFTRQKCDPFSIRRRMNKGWEIIRQGRQGEFIDHAVTGIIPSRHRQGDAGTQDRKDQREMYFHVGGKAW